MPKVNPRNPKPKPKPNKKPATRKEAYSEVAKRDKGVCQYPGCYKRNVNMHHIIYRSHLGKNDVENLVTLCLEHHTAGKNSPHQSSAWRRYWEGWAEEKYPEYWANIREGNKIRVGGI